MNLIQAKDSLLFLVSQWLGTTVPRLLAAFAGLLLLVLVAQALWDRRLRLVPATIGAVCGGALIAMALDTRVLHWLAGLDEQTRLRVSVGVLSSLVLATAFEAIRRMRLQERYAILWMAAGGLTLLGAIFPKTLDVVGLVFGTDYTASILAVFFIAVALVLFHFSLALSRSDHRESRMAQRFALLESRLEQLERRLDEPGPATVPQPLRQAAVAEQAPREPALAWRPRSGSHLAAVIVIALSGAWALWTGWRAPEPMVGDEVTHFYMLQNQSRSFPTPTFFAKIPVGWDGRPEVRGYPHVDGWHYIGAAVYRFTGGSRRAVQFWHTLFWVQFLAVGYLLALGRGGDRTRAAILFLMVLASLPAAVMFAVLFYQDVPMAAQVLTAFYLLVRGRRRWALLFLLFALALKETAYLFVPSFLCLWAWLSWRETAAAGARGWRSWRPGVAAAALAGALVVVCSLGWADLLQRHAQSYFYPMVSLQKTWHHWKERAGGGAGEARRTPAAKPELIVTPRETRVIANHPGDLRIPKNYLVFGGALLWIVAAVGGAARIGRGVCRTPREGPSTGWLWFVGLSYAIPAAYILRTAPDARFFLPAVPFLALPLAEWAVKVPRVKTWLALVSVLALMQTGAVHAKVHQLRVVSPALRDAIAFLRANPPEPRRVFMYPEGNYRLFPVPHEWYLGYHLREFWKGDNTARIALLNKYKVGAIVVKKHLVAAVDDRITDLGVYPTYFLKDIERDSRFTKVFDNSAVAIYRVPPSN
jgi:hypothetical protein